MRRLAILVLTATAGITMAAAPIQLPMANGDGDGKILLADGQAAVQSWDDGIPQDKRNASYCKNLAGAPRFSSITTRLASDTSSCTAARSSELALVRTTPGRSGSRRTS